MKEPDVFLRHIRKPNGLSARVYLRACADSQECLAPQQQSGPRFPGVCPNCWGAVLTDKEKEFLFSRRVKDEQKFGKAAPL
jgi:hypothetical protein